MAVVNIHDAKTHLSRLISDVLKGKTVVIAKAGVPMVKMTIYAEELPKREGSQLKGLIEISDNFDAPLPADVLAGFYDGGKK